MSNKEQKKAKVVKLLHTAADKTGKFVRKAGPIVGAFIGGIVLESIFGGKDESNKA